MKQVLRMNQLVEMLGLSKATIHRLRNSGQFVQPISLGPRSVGYLEEDVTQWLSERKSAQKDISPCRAANQQS